MDCPFCSQWNPPGQRRCSFCNNALDAQEDRTVAGTPAYANKPSSSLPVVPSGSRRGRRRNSGKVRVGGFSIQLSQDQWIGVGISLLVLIVMLSSRC